MGRYDENTACLPLRVKAAFEYLHLARIITEQVDAAIPMRALTPLEKSVEAAALRTLQQYLLGEMDFAETPAQSAPSRRGGDDASPQAVNATT